MDDLDRIRFTAAAAPLSLELLRAADLDVLIDALCALADVGGCDLAAAGEIAGRLAVTFAVARRARSKE